ncbi:MAG: hypothetical protein IKX14_02710 [Neisseriaceae bacterium]|nr:hypothetical protein [Neisseriaceae bacterium]
MAIVRYKSSEIPPTTQEDIDRIRAIKDEDIDYSDIPKLTEDFWKNAMTVEEAQAFRMELAKMEAEIKAMFAEDEKNIQGLFGRELVSWLVKHGKKYQTQLKEVLQQFALQHS